MVNDCEQGLKRLNLHNWAMWRGGSERRAQMEIYSISPIIDPITRQIRNQRTLVTDLARSGVVIQNHLTMIRQDSHLI